MFVLCSGFDYHLCHPVDEVEDGLMASRQFFSQFSSLVLCFAAAYVWLVVG